MRKGTGIAGATLLYSGQQGRPDLLTVMQSLVDDLRADNRRIVGLHQTNHTLRLRSDPWDMVLTLAEQPLPLASMGGLLRPPRPDDTPDFARVHLARTLRLHSQALGFLLRRRGPMPADMAVAARALTREGQLCLLAIFHAAPPALLIWQPGGLVLTPEELRLADPAVLLTPRSAAVPLGIPRPERLSLARPVAVRPTALPQPERTGADPPAAVTKSPPPRLFGADSTAAPVPIPGLERASDRVASALRGAGPPRLVHRLTDGAQTRAARRPILHRAGPMAVILMWAALLPTLMARILPGF